MVIVLMDLTRLDFQIQRNETYHMFHMISRHYRIRPNENGIFQAKIQFLLNVEFSVKITNFIFWRFSMIFNTDSILIEFCHFQVLNRHFYALLPHIDPISGQNDQLLVPIRRKVKISPT